MVLADRAGLRLTIGCSAADGTFIDAFGSGGTGDGQFNFPNGVAVAASGNIYVADSNNHRVEKFDSTGTFVTSFVTSAVEMRIRRMPAP